jgi:hypothetical protein
MPIMQAKETPTGPLKVGIRKIPVPPSTPLSIRIKKKTPTSLRHIIQTIEWIQKNPDKIFCSIIQVFIQELDRKFHSDFGERKLNPQYSKAVQSLRLPTENRINCFYFPNTWLNSSAKKANTNSISIYREIPVDNNPLTLHIGNIVITLTPTQKWIKIDANWQLISEKERYQAISNAVYALFSRCHNLSIVEVDLSSPFDTRLCIQYIRAYEHLKHSCIQEDTVPASIHIVSHGIEPSPEEIQQTLCEITGEAYTTFCEIFPSLKEAQNIPTHQDQLESLDPSSLSNRC